MEQIVYDNILMVAYLLLWVLTFAWYQHKGHAVDAGSAIILSYVGYAFFSILTYNEPIEILVTYIYDPLRLFPFIYLYIMLMIALSPIIYHHIHPVKKIDSPHSRIFKILGLLSICCAVVLIPSIIGNFREGLVMLFLDNDAGKDAYEEQLKGAQDSGSAIRNLPAIVYNTLFEISVFTSFYFLSLKKRTVYITLPLMLSLLVGLLMPIMKGQRGVVIINFLTIIAGYMLFRRFLSKRINKTVNYMGVIAIIVLSLPIAAITLSRYQGKKTAVSDYINWYIGQGNLYFNNHGLDAGGIRYGDRTFNLFKRLVDKDTPKNYVERRDKYHNLDLDDNLFSTFVGDFTIDFGPYVAVVIFVLFNFWVLKQIRARGDTIRLHQLLLLFFTVCICMQGGMTLFSFADTGNLRIIAFALLYFYLRYHDVLLKRYPLHICNAYDKEDIQTTL